MRKAKPQTPPYQPTDEELRALVHRLQDALHPVFLAAGSEAEAALLVHGVIAQAGELSERLLFAHPEEALSLWRSFGRALQHAFPSGSPAPRAPAGPVH